MRHAILVHTIGALCLVGAWASPAAAQGPPPELKLACTLDKRQAKVGDDVTVELRLTNHGTTKAIGVRPLALDERSITIVVAWTEKTAKPNSQEIVETEKHYQLVRYHFARGKHATLAFKPLPVGESIAMKITIPCVRAGELRINANFGGFHVAPTTKLWSNKCDLFVSTPGSGKLGATIETTHGTIEVELDRKLMPATVSHFVMLARSGVYANTRFFRKIPGAWIQGGDIVKNDGTGQPGWTIPFEIPQDGLGQKHAAGTLSMSRGAHVNTAASQFFFSLRTLPQYDFGNGFPHNVFGKLVKGPDVLRKIDAVPVGPHPEAPYKGEKSRPLEPVSIKKVSFWVR